MCCATTRWESGYLLKRLVSQTRAVLAIPIHAAAVRQALSPLFACYGSKVRTFMFVEGKISMFLYSFTCPKDLWDYLHRPCTIYVLHGCKQTFPTATAMARVHQIFKQPWQMPFHTSFIPSLLCQYRPSMEYEVDSLSWNATEELLDEEGMISFSSSMSGINRKFPCQQAVVANNLSSAQCNQVLSLCEKANLTASSHHNYNI